jgi:hypothetical protein
VSGNEVGVDELCLICGVHGATQFNGHENGYLIVCQECRVCGRWCSKPDLFVPNRKDPEQLPLLPYLAAHIRRSNAAGVRTVDLEADTWREAAEAHARSPIRKRLDLLLRLIERRTDYAGQYREIAQHAGIYPLVDAHNDDEVEFLAETLASQGLLERMAQHDYRITAHGWEYLQPASGGEPGTCFVAMSFDSSLDLAFDDGIMKALEGDCGYLANRVDRRPHNDNITDRILAGIRGAQFVVADFTLQRQGVYYEAGFAEGLGRTVIRTCRDTDFDNLHFDTRQFFHLKWATPADLRMLLADHVLATLGRWSGR